MIEVKEAYEALIQSGIDMFTGVPDSLLKNICAYITDTAPRHKHIIAANEGNAVGIAAGHYLATAKPALVYMQNSGLGNTVNPLLSLADEKVYSIPMVLMIGWRGEPGVHDEPQHVKQGEVTLSLLDAIYRLGRRQPDSSPGSAGAGTQVAHGHRYPQGDIWQVPVAAQDGERLPADPRGGYEVSRRPAA